VEQIKVMIQYCLESSIENDETSLKLDIKVLDRETNKKKKKMFEVRTLEERARASFLEGPWGSLV
jgi:hypothetical protein